MKLSLYYPVKGYISQGFGNVVKMYTDLNLKGHNGIDISVPTGSGIYAAHDGIVTYAGEDGSNGYLVVIRTTEQYDYQSGQSYFKTLYGHLLKGGIKVTAGQKVKAGDLLALSDNSGLSTGPHLHWGLKPVLQGEADWQWYNLEQDNGYNGAIDPQPYLNGKYAEDIGLKTYYFDTNLCVGSRGEKVRYLQQYLVDKGYLPKDCVTGYYGRLTQQAVYKVQVEYQMPLGLDWLYFGFYFGPKMRSFLNLQSETGV